MNKWIDTADELPCARFAGTNLNDPTAAAILPLRTADVLVRTATGLILTGHIDTAGRWWINSRPLNDCYLHANAAGHAVAQWSPLPERRDCRTTKLGADLTTGLGADP